MHGLSVHAMVIHIKATLENTVIMKMKQTKIHVINLHSSEQGVALTLHGLLWFRLSLFASESASVPDIVCVVVDTLRE